MLWENQSWSQPMQRALLLLYILVMIIFLSVIAPIAALVEWRKKEGAYVAAKLGARVNSIKTDRRGPSRET